MKKHLRFAIAAVLTLALICSATVVPVLADSETLLGTGISFVDVEVEYIAPSDNRAEIEAGTEGTRIYSVTLDWEPSGRIIYNAGKTIYSWNNQDLQYDTEVTDKGWTVLDAKVKITAKNRSNRPIEMSCSEPVSIDAVKLSGSYDRSTVTVPSAAVNGFDGVGAEQTASVVYTVSSVSGDISANTENIATITIIVTGK